MKRWSPYWVGMGIGILSWLAFFLSDKPIGVSTAYAQTSGMIEKALQGRKVEEKEYYRQYVPKVSWTWMLVVGLLAGAFASAATSGDFRLEWVPPLWERRFGDTPVIRWATAFSGGIIFGIGFAILGYCPGTLAGAAGQGSLDALLGGVPGMVVGTGIYAALYPRLSGGVLRLGEFEKETIPQILGLKPWPVIGLVALAILLIFAVLEIFPLA
jgi:hypothetical protein